MSKYITEAFAARLYSALSADSSSLPVEQEAYDDLVALLAEDDTYTYATICDDQSYETVKLYLSGGVLVMDRAQAGTLAVRHECGAKVSLVSPTTLAAIRDIICQYDCCEDTDCPCEAVYVLGDDFQETYSSGSQMSAHVVFGGTLPIVAVTDGAPSWMTVSILGNAVTFSGTPPNSGSYSVTVAASNCNGIRLCTTRFSFSVS